ncbi:MAG: hypothetical protein P4L42_13380 [Desulfocapsaceae bacterium]|nr:hypothetical protein [Desulfocapsaceae bacterium]
MNSQSASAFNRSAIVAPLLALLYPFFLQGFNETIGTFLSKGLYANPVSWIFAVFFLASALAVPLVAFAFAVKFSKIAKPTDDDRRAKGIALLAVATPPIFTFIGVLFYMAGVSMFDKWLVTFFWLALIGSLVWPRKKAVIRCQNPVSPKPIAAHGISALFIIIFFLLLHISNHLFGLTGPAAQMAVMKTLRIFYRSTNIEPILVVFFLFQIASGIYLIQKNIDRPGDSFRTFQIASGVYLVFFLMSHMNAVFIFARTFMGIDSDWNFATGAPTGLLKDPWNIRLVPLYLFAVFFALMHSLSGMRFALLKQGFSKTILNRLVVIGSIFSAGIAILISLGMCGWHV